MKLFHGHCRRYNVSKRRIIPLPIYKADPQFYPEALFRAKQVSEPHRVGVIVAE